MSDEMTTERLAEIEARASAATPGPWDHTDDRCVLVDHRPDGSPVEWWCRGYRTCAQAAADARFMANARADVPALVAEVRRPRRDPGAP